MRLLRALDLSVYCMKSLYMMELYYMEDLAGVVLIRDGPVGECQSGQVQVHVQVTPEPEENQQENQTESSFADTDSSLIKMPLTVSLPTEEKTGIENRGASFMNQSAQTSETESDSNNKSPAPLQEVKCGMTLSGLEKQEWSFTLYDFEGRGRVTKEDLGRLMKSLYHSVGASLSGPSEGTKTLNLRLTVNPDIGSIENMPAAPKTVHVHHRRLHHEHRHRRKKHHSPSKQVEQNNFDIGQAASPKVVLGERELSSEQKISNITTTDSSNNDCPLQPYSKLKHTPDLKSSTSPETRNRNIRRPKSAHKRHSSKHKPLQPTENTILEQPQGAATADLSAQMLNLDMSEEQNTSESQGLLHDSSRVHASPSAGQHHKSSPEKSHRKKYRHRHKYRDEYETGSPDKRHSRIHQEGIESPAVNRTIATEQEHATSVTKPRSKTHALKSRKSRPLSMPVDSGWIMGPGNPAIDCSPRHEHHHVHEHHHHHHHYHWYQS